MATNEKNSFEAGEPPSYLFIWIKDKKIEILTSACAGASSSAIVSLDDAEKLALWLNDAVRQIKKEQT